MITRAEAVDRMARIYAAVPELAYDAGTLRALFKAVTKFTPADRWLAELARDVQARLSEVRS